MEPLRDIFKPTNYSFLNSCIYSLNLFVSRVISTIYIIESLTDSNDPAQYFKKLKERDEELAKLTDKGGVQFVPPLMLGIKTIGGVQKAYCWNTEGIFRIVQSIPSPKAEPFKRWLAKVGYERVQEIESPELATKRTRMLYKLKGYSEDWIEKRRRNFQNGILNMSTQTI